MNSLERVAATLQFQEPDRVPVYPLLNGVSRHLVGADYPTWANDADVCAEAYVKITEKYGLDVICTLTDLSVEAADFGAKINYPKDEAASPDYANPLITEAAGYSRIKPINPRLTPRMSEHIKLCDKLVKAKGKEVPIVAFVFGPLGITSMLRGQADLFMDIVLEPDRVKQAVEAVTQTLIDYCDVLIDTGVHAIMLDTLFASQSIMSKDMWREFEGGYVKRIAAHVHDRGRMFMIHNCGKGIYFDAQIEAMQPEAISFLHLPDDVKSPAELKEKYGSKTALIGHVDPTWVIDASEEEVRAECEKQIDQYKAGGGFILATGCEYPANASLRSAEVIIETAKTYGVYEDK